MVCALGAAEQLVGRSHECDFPPEVEVLPACTEARIDFDAIQGKPSSSEINRQVTDLMKNAEPLYRIDAKRLRELQPDIIITQAQCEACAVSLREVEEIIGSWPGNHPQIISLAPERLADIWENIRSVSNALELGDQGREVLRALKNRVVNVIEKACLVKERPTVACIEWIEPLMAAGNWVPELVDLAGGIDVVGKPGKHSDWMEWPALVKHDPKFIIMMPCGFDLDRTRTEVAALANHPEWSKLDAVKHKRVFLVDGNQFFNRPGPRIVESLEIMAEIINGDRFHFGHRGKAWERVG